MLFPCSMLASQLADEASRAISSLAAMKLVHLKVC